ncbi:MAG: hypothetical protein GX795_00490 [Firmicutes bacterium]|jgi:hypothetical protein|nr:hypothetical protein [Bacillota bacterium]
MAIHLERYIVMILCGCHHHNPLWLTSKELVSLGTGDQNRPPEKDSPTVGMAMVLLRRRHAINCTDVRNNLLALQSPFF